MLSEEAKLSSDRGRAKRLAVSVFRANRWKILEPPGVTFLAF